MRARNKVMVETRDESLGRTGAAGDAALTVEGLSVGYVDADQRVNTVVWDVSFSLERGRIMGLAGESGCGKSTAALASIGYRAPGMRILSGRSMFGGIDLLSLSRPELRRIWGGRIAYVAQQATTALNPAMLVGRQLAQPIVAHTGLQGAALRQRQIELLEMVEIPDAARALRRYPFQFSGGQQQRIAIAIALGCGPEVLLLDEPATGLDVTTQARISALLVSLIGSAGIAALYVSHDLALLGTLTQRVTVMYAGQEAESGGTHAMITRPRHPYTRELLRAVPNLHEPGRIAGIPGRPPTSVVLDKCAYSPRCGFVTDACLAGAIGLAPVEGDQVVRCLRAAEISSERAPAALLPRADAGSVLLEVNGLWCSYRNAPEPVVKDVSFEVRAGETLGIVGESGSGKSTLLRAIAGLVSPTAGTIRFDGAPLAAHAVKRPRSVRHQLQVVFQNPDTSLNPRHTVAGIITRPIRLFRRDVTRSREQDVVAELLESVKLPRKLMQRYPPELSGGQQQRVAIARAFAANPSALLCDEITSALDVSVQATILELLAELSIKTGTAIIFVAHDLAVVRTIATNTIVMRAGEICERGPTDRLFEDPQHEYTQALMRAIPELPRSELPESESN